MLSFFESLKPLEDLTLKQLSYLTVLLLAFTSGAQPHELLLVDLSCSLKREGSWEFTLPTDIKTSRPGHLAHKFCFIPSFPENVKTCVVCSLVAYIERTEMVQ